MVPIIRAILENLIGKEEADRIEIVANEVDTSKGSGPGQWTIKYRHPESSVLPSHTIVPWFLPLHSGCMLIEDEGLRSIYSGFGHDKDRCISPYRSLSERPTIFFCGDGVSDLSAARSADCLFVKLKEGTGNDLAKHCESEGIKHVKFHSFNEVKQVVESVVEGKKKVEDVLNWYSHTWLD